MDDISLDNNPFYQAAQAKSKKYSATPMPEGPLAKAVDKYAPVARKPLHVLQEEGKIAAQQEIAASAREMAELKPENTAAVHTQILVELERRHIEQKSYGDIEPELPEELVKRLKPEYRDGSFYVLTLPENSPRFAGFAGKGFGYEGKEFSFQGATLEPRTLYVQNIPHGSVFAEVYTLKNEPCAVFGEDRNYRSLGQGFGLLRDVK